MGIQKIVPSVSYSQGCDVACSDTSKFGDAVNIAKSANITVLVIGLDQGQERLINEFINEDNKFFLIYQYLFYIVGRGMIGLPLVSLVTRDSLYNR